MPSCKSCGGEGHSRRSSKSCANYLPPIRQRSNCDAISTEDFDLGVVKRGLNGVLCPLLEENVHQRLTAEIRSDVMELSRLYILLGVFVNHCWNAYPTDESNSVRTFQHMMYYVYAIKGKGPHAHKFEDMVRYHDNIKRYNGQLRSYIVQEMAKTYWTVLKTNITTHAYSRLARYFGVKRNDPTLYAAYYHKEFGDDEISRVCRFINVSSEWYSTIPLWIIIQREMYARGERSFVIFPQPSHGLKHVTYTSRGWHELLRRVDPSTTTSSWPSISDHKRELWAPYLDTNLVDMKKFGCCIQTDGVAVSLSMNRPKKKPIIRKATTSMLSKSYSTDAFYEDRIVAVDPGSRVPVAACDSRTGFKRITKRWVRSHTLEWKRERYRSRKLRSVELDEASDRQRVELDRGVQLTCRNGERVKLYTDFRLKWLDARQRPFERTRKLTRSSFDKYLMTARTNERIVRETFLGDSPSDRVLVLYGAGVNFVNVACYSGRKFKHTDLLRRLRSRRNIKVRLVDESYTSKACSVCNERRNGTYTRLRMNHRLRRGVCPDCNADVERDYNAAKNILVNFQRLGTWQAPPEVIESAVYKALDMGYRHIDTAFNYNNEDAIGRAVKKWTDDGKGARSDLFITTKLPHVGNRASDVRTFLELQLKRLQVNYVDLYLIHVPFGFMCDPKTLTPIVKETGDYELDVETNHVSTWQVMEECQKQGLIHNIGLSNFNEKQIEKIMQEANFKPQVLQVELHAYFQQPELQKFCQDNDIVLTAYAPLGSPGAKAYFVNKYKYSSSAFPDLFTLPDVKAIAERHKKTSAQILLNFLVHEKIVVIPKSTNEQRIKENMDIYDFELTSAEVECLRKLDKGENGRIFNFLFWKGVENHPEYPFKILQTAQA